MQLDTLAKDRSRKSSGDWNEGDRVDTRESDIYGTDSIGPGASGPRSVSMSVVSSRKSTVVDGREYYYGNGTGGFNNYH